MRDLGRFTTRSGKITKFRRIIRSDLPENLSLNEIAFIKKYGVKHIIDLRSNKSYIERPSAFKQLTGYNYYNIPLSDNPILSRIDFCPLEHYVAIVSSPNKIFDILKTISECGNGAILYHCLVGKDKAGIDEWGIMSYCKRIGLTITQIHNIQSRLLG